MTREEVVEIMNYCKEHKVTYKSRLEELNIPVWRFYDSKSRYAAEQSSGKTAQGEFIVSIRPTTGIKPLYTTIATVTMNLIVSAAIVLLNPYVTVYISYKIPPFALSVHIPDVSTSIYVEVDSKVLLGLPFCDKAFVR